MAAISIGDAIQQVMDSTGWKQRVLEIRIKREWEQIVGKTISKYTADVFLRNKVLSIKTTVAPLKQELHYGKQHLIQNINDYFGEVVVKDILIG